MNENRLLAGFIQEKIKEGRPKPPDGLFFLGGDHHDHLPAFQARARLNYGFFSQIGLDALGHFDTQLLVRHFATLEADVHFDLVTLFQEAADIAQFDAVIADVGGGAEFDFLDFDHFLLLLGGCGFLLQLEAVFAVIHDATDRWILVGLDFNQIHAGFFGEREGFVAGQDTDHLAVGADDADARDADFLVLAVTFF
jgi:hypothetical protein